MKVKCIKTSTEHEYHGQLINDKMDEYLEVESIFHVYGLRYNEDIIYLYIYNDYHLFEVPIEMFDIIDEQVYEGWKVQRLDNGDLTIWPDLFYEEGFLERFAEMYRDERQRFELLRSKIEVEQ